MTPDDVRFFDCKEEYTVVWKDLPHWTQAGTLAFVTWRTADSMPEEVLQEWNRERDQILLANGIDPKGQWKQKLGMLNTVNRSRLRWLLFSAWDLRLDHAAGACLLADERFSEIVLTSLLHFDGDRYLLTDAVIMPNHVHLIAAFQSEDALLNQCTSWKHFTATAIRRLQRTMPPTVDPPLRRREFPEPPLPTSMNANASESQPAERLDNSTYHKQAFWQPDQFDHLIRSDPQFVYFRRYIANNPKRANLKSGSYRLYSRAM
jgi:type I restriction enzyme R subunit